MLSQSISVFISVIDYMTSHSISVLISVTLTFGPKDNRGDVAALLFLPFFAPPLATE